MKKALFFAMVMGMIIAFGGCGDEKAATSASVGTTAETQVETAAEKEAKADEPKAVAGDTEQAAAQDTQDENYTDEEQAKLAEAEAYEQGSDSDVPGTSKEDKKGLTSKHGKAYVYVWAGNEYLRDDGTWEFVECDGYIQDGDKKLQRTLTVYRYSDSSALEYMLEFAGDWGEYWHVNYDYDPDATYFDCVENGYVTLSGNKAIWKDEYYEEFKEIYVLESTHEFDD